MTKILLRKTVTLIFFLMLSCFLSVASAVRCGDQIIEDFILDEELSCQGSGLILNHSRISLDCGGNAIRGRGTGNGLEILGTGSSVKNCLVDGFENGLLTSKVSSIVVENSAFVNNLIGVYAFEVIDVELSKNVIANNSFYGAYIKDSLKVRTEENIFGGNREDIYTLTTGVGDGEPVENQQAENINPSNLSEQVTDVPVQTPGVTKLTKLTKKSVEPTALDVGVEISAKVARSLDAKKKVVIGDNKTSYILAMIAKKDVKSLKITEEIPKEVASSSSEIASETSFTVVREGDARSGPTIRFELVDIKKGAQKTVTYTLSKEVLSEFAIRPTTFLLLEEAINPGASWTIRLLFSMVLMLLACSLYFAKALHRHRHFLVHLVVFCGGIVLFVLLNLQVEIVVSEVANNVVVGIILAVIVVGLGILNWRYLQEFLHRSREQRKVEELEF